MSNMSPFGNAKNTPWGRTSVGNPSANLVNQTSPLQQQLISQGALGTLNTTGMVQFQQQHQQVFQNAMGMQQQNLGIGLQPMGNPTVAVNASGLGTQIPSNQIFQQVGAVTYPNPRALNPNAFQTQAVNTIQQQNTSTKQRVFTGTVTKVHDNFGFVDEDVFFQTTACVKGSNPMVGDRVLVEASYNSNMPFKWNATRIQVLPMTTQPSVRHSSTKSFNSNSSGNSGYNAVPPPNDSSNGNFGRNSHRNKGAVGGRRERSRDKDREEEEIERKRRREERMREREKEEKKSPLRRRSRSPKARRRSRIVPRYMVQIPKIALDLPLADVLEVRRRYTNLYIPSDFFYTRFRWVDAFPPDKPFSLNKPCQFHIMNKDVEPVVENDAILEPPDADYFFCAKVMLMSVPGMEDLYQKCCAMAEDRDRRDRDSEDKDYVHPTRLVNFLVGLRGKNETMAIGGPWSPSLDGANPQGDPMVLIRTAIRTCKALTGIDLSNCTQWYRFLELYYRRSESTHKGKVVPARVETVVLFLPDVWSCIPTRLEWDGLHHSYGKHLERRLTAAAAAVAQQQQPQEGDEQATASATATAAADEKEEEPLADKVEPTHYSQLDPKSMSVGSLRCELKARGVSHKGLKSQLVARLTKVLKGEAAEKSEDGVKEANAEVEVEVQEEKKAEVEEKKIDEKEKAQLQKLYTLPDSQHIIVHPSRTAKQGKFDCTTMSLSLLLDYRPEDTKEHSFEVSLFAELFNEMLMRDFGFNIYKALFDLPEKPKDKEDKRKKDDDKSKDDDDKKKGDDKKKEDKEKKDEQDKKSDEKKEDKKSEDSKRRDSKKDDKRSENDTDDEDEFEEDEQKDRKKDRKRKKPKMYTKDRHLLLSFVYFDQTHCGYIFEKDIEDLLHTLGLYLSRAQVRKLVGKVITRDSLHYRKLTDQPKDEDFIVIDDSEKDVNLHELAVGNKKLLPVFRDERKGGDGGIDGENSEGASCDGMVKYSGALVDVGKLISQLERSDKARVDTESCMVDLKSENSKLLEKVSKSNSSIKHLNSELKEYKEKLKTNEDSLSKITANLKLFQNTLTEIRDKVDPVLKSVQAREEIVSKKEQDHKHEEKTRWERDSKDNVAIKEEAMDVDSKK